MKNEHKLFEELKKMLFSYFLQIISIEIVYQYISFYVQLTLSTHFI
jgi:hypothetical protein